MTVISTEVMCSVHFSTGNVAANTNNVQLKPDLAGEQGNCTPAGNRILPPKKKWGTGVKEKFYLRAFGTRMALPQEANERNSHECCCSWRVVKHCVGFRNITHKLCSCTVGAKTIFAVHQGWKFYISKHRGVSVMSLSGGHTTVCTVGSGSLLPH